MAKGKGSSSKKGKAPSGNKEKAPTGTTSNRWTVQTITSKTSDTEPTILVCFDEAKYYFNLGENLTRAVLQSRRGFRKVKSIFLTQVSTRAASGIPGFLMCTADSSAREVDIVSPKGGLHLFASMRPYMYRETLALNVIEVPEATDKLEPVYKDDKITVYAIATSNAAAENSSLKRKRKLSENEPSKRLAAEQRDKEKHASSGAAIPISANASLAGASSHVDTRSGSSSNSADDLRREIVRHMFTWTKPAHEQDVAPKRVPRVPSVAGMRDQLPKVDIDPSRALAYVVIGRGTRGKFDPKRAAELGLIGRDRAIVASGQAVTIEVDDGEGGKTTRTIQPEDILGESAPPTAVMILDVPTPGHIDSLIAGFSQPFYAEMKSKLPEHAKKLMLHGVYHLLGKGVMDDPRYQDFLRDFPDQTHHFISAPEYAPDPITFTAASLSQLRLNQIDPEIFPLLKFNLNAPKPLSDTVNLPPNMHVLQANSILTVYPPKPPHLDDVLQLRDQFHPAVTAGDPWILQDDTKARFDAAKESVRTEVAERQMHPTRPGDDLAVIPLGTSSAVCSRYRNFSGYLLQIPGNPGHILLDPGEGTYGQLARLFGTDESAPDNVGDVLRNIRAIFISHGHADHHAGLAKILAMRRQLSPPPSQPLFLITNRIIHLYLREQQDLEDFGLVESLEEHNSRSGFAGSVVPILTEAIHDVSPMSVNLYSGWRDPSSSRTSAQALCAALNLQSVVTTDVKHTCLAHGIIIKSHDGWKFVYSGDTIPTSSLSASGKDATLLLHEATMADDLADMARAKGHSTVGEALSVAKEMQAENVILTHFSTRYPKIPQNDFEQKPGEPTVALAFDHARLRVRDLWKISHYITAIEKTIGETREEDEEDEEKQMLEASKYQ